MAPGGGERPDPGSTGGSSGGGSDKGGVGGCGAGDGGLSSRVYKKNIKEFKDHEAALSDILKTPLFKYKFKENFPDKTRMGVISEDLPEHLQLKQKGSPSHPDWPSIYGTLWSGIKAVVSRLEKILSRVNALEKENKQLKAETSRIQSELKREITALKKQVKKLKSEQ